MVKDQSCVKNFDFDNGQLKIVNDWNSHGEVENAEVGPFFLLTNQLGGHHIDRNKFLSRCLQNHCVSDGECEQHTASRASITCHKQFFLTCARG